ncbi:hypothetical protein H4219_001857 [Mycoemilia scoparia]|uniref:BZIP domain-containing protein n=1 Tax=Mycoemilia scoparia TaxID=417184 RepID=A0A9W8DRC2_9FUNG|nr:hypothetical protein H4219_001857 [Mycoemilia scoparia]
MDGSDVFETFINPSLVDSSMDVTTSDSSNTTTLMGSPSSSKAASSSPTSGMDSQTALDFWLGNNETLFGAVTGPSTPSTVNSPASSLQFPPVSAGGAPAGVDPSNISTNQALLDCLNDPQQLDSLLTTLFPGGTMPSITPDNILSIFPNNNSSITQQQALADAQKTPTPASTNKPMNDIPAAKKASNISNNHIATTLVNNDSTAMDVETPSVNKKATTTTAATRKTSVSSKAPQAKQTFKSSTDNVSSKENDDELDGIDIKSLSSKERRQLRNKISARNFRVRRKEYIGNLEGQVKQYQDENKKLTSELSRVKGENVQLRDELQLLRKQLESLSLSIPSSSKQGLKTIASRSTASASAETSRPTSPIVRFRPNKDVPPNGNTSKSGSSQWSASKNTVITVQTVLVPDTSATAAAVIASSIEPATAAPTTSNFRSATQPSSPYPHGLDQLLGRTSIQVPSFETMAIFYSALIDIVSTQCALESTSFAAAPPSPLVPVFA